MDNLLPCDFLTSTALAGWQMIVRVWMIENEQGQRLLTFKVVDQYGNTSFVTADQVRTVKRVTDKKRHELLTNLGPGRHWSDLERIRSHAKRNPGHHNRLDQAGHADHHAQAA